jgi:hypothetical protein
MSAAVELSWEINLCVVGDVASAPGLADGEKAEEEKRNIRAPVAVLLGGSWGPWSE